MRPLGASISSMAAALPLFHTCSNQRSTIALGSLDMIPPAALQPNDLENCVDFVRAWQRCQHPDIRPGGSEWLTAGIEDDVLNRPRDRVILRSEERSASVAAVDARDDSHGKPRG